MKEWKTRNHECENVSLPDGEMIRVVCLQIMTKTRLNGKVKNNVKPVIKLHWKHYRWMYNTLNNEVKHPLLI